MLSGKRTAVELEQIPDFFLPFTGRFGLRSQCLQSHFSVPTDTLTCYPLDLNNVFVDDESYNSGHGHAYEVYGCSENTGAMVIVRPDQRECLPLSSQQSRIHTHGFPDVSAIIGIEEHDVLEDFFARFLCSASCHEAVDKGVTAPSRKSGGSSS